MSITPQNNRDLNQGLSHLWSKFGDPSLNGWWVIARTNLVTDGRTDAGNDNTQRPILASGRNCEVLYHILVPTQPKHFNNNADMNRLNWYRGIHFWVHHIIFDDNTQNDDSFCLLLQLVSTHQVLIHNRHNSISVCLQRSQHIALLRNQHAWCWLQGYIWSVNAFCTSVVLE